MSDYESSEGWTSDDINNTLIKQKGIDDHMRSKSQVDTQDNDIPNMTTNWDKRRRDVPGVKYDNDKPRYSLMPQDALHEVVKVLTYGAKKYSDDNWKKVPDLQRRYKDAAGRHEYQGNSNDFDEETGLYHLAHKICCDIFRLQDKIDKAGN